MFLQAHPPFVLQNMDYAGSSTAENLIGLLKQIIKCKNQQIITNKIVYKFSWTRLYGYDNINILKL